MWTAYLHMHSFAPGLTIGTSYPAGTFLGYVGDTGAETPHLHFTYMVGLTSEANNESKSRNPLEIFPHTSPVGQVTATFDYGANHRVRVQLPAQRNTIRWIILRGTKSGQPFTRIVDYYDIVAQGSTNRNAQNQYGLNFDVDAPVQASPAGGGTINLYVKPASGGSNSFDPNRIIIRDFNGNVILDQTG
jgi:murein DD-endopeptidase MepM/ murein hydrolase activator NlpD